MSLAAFRLSSQRLIPIVVRNDIPQDNDSAGFHPAPQVISPDELTRRLPRGLYTTFSTNHNGTRVLGLSAHLKRLNLPTPASRADLRLALSQLASANAPGESRLRVLVSDSDGTVYVIVQPFAPPAKEIYERGVNVITAGLTRRDPRLKDSGFIAASQSQRAQVGGDIYEVLLTRKGMIYEGMTSNFYVVPQTSVCVPPKMQTEVCVPPKMQTEVCVPPKMQTEVCGTLVTARTGILLGVTRRVVLRLARGQGMDIEYRAPRLEEDFAEAFLTSSSRGIVPIVQIDDRRVGQGTVGAWTKRLSLAYQVYVEERSEGFVP